MRYAVLFLVFVFGHQTAHANEVPISKIANLQARLNKEVTLSDPESQQTSANVTYYAYFQKGAQVVKNQLDPAAPYCQFSSLEDDYKKKQLPTKTIPPIFDDSAFSSDRAAKPGEPQVHFYFSQKIGEEFHMLFVNCFNSSPDALPSDIASITGGAITLSIRPLRTEGRTAEQLKADFENAAESFRQARPPLPEDYANELKFGQKWECETWYYTEVVRGRPHEIEYTPKSAGYDRQFSERVVGNKSYIVDNERVIYVFETFKEGLFARMGTGIGVALFSYRVFGDELRFMSAYNKKYEDISALPDAVGLKGFKALGYGACTLKK